MRFIFKFCLLFFMCSCSMMSHKKEKIKGVSFVASRDSIALEHIKPIINLNANNASIMPFGFIKDLQHPEIVFNMDSQWFGETNAGTRQYNEALKSEEIGRASCRERV